MDIVVCIKQVPETTEVAWDPKTGALMRESVQGVLNPNDKHAIEAALRLREGHGGFVTALSMGPSQAEEVLREALSMGVDGAILLSDPLLAGADTLSTSYTLGLAVKKIGRFDLILCGKETSDGMTGQVGPQLAELLNLAQLTYATEITIKNRSVRIKQKQDDGFRILETALPALVTVERGINKPRIPPMDSILEAYSDKVVQVWTAQELGGDRERFDLTGSPTQSRRVYSRKVTKGQAAILEGEPNEVARALIQILKQKDLV
jgi:electron transfer flavoprotein alpha/beta subunit